MSGPERPQFVLGSTDGSCQVTVQLLGAFDPETLYVEIEVVGERLHPADLRAQERDFAVQYRRRVGLGALAALARDAFALAQAPRSSLATSLGVTHDVFDLALEPASILGSFRADVRLAGTRADSRVQFPTDVTCLDRLACTVEAFVKQARLAARRDQA